MNPRRPLMDRIFDFPFAYRAKVSLVKLLVRPVSAALIRNKFDEDAVILSAVADGMRVFEMGAGDGNGLRLLSRAGRSVAYFGSDFNSRMVEFCREHYPQASWENYSGGAYAHADRSFDLCIIRHVLHHIPSRSDIVETVREALRMAKVVLLLEPLQSENIVLKKIKSIYWRVTDGGANYMTLDELHEVLKEAGGDITWEVATEPLRQAFACTMTAAHRDA